MKKILVSGVAALCIGSASASECGWSAPTVELGVVYQQLGVQERDMDHGDEDFLAYKGWKFAGNKFKTPGFNVGVSSGYVFNPHFLLEAGVGVEAYLKSTVKHATESYIGDLGVAEFTGVQTRVNGPKVRVWVSPQYRLGNGDLTVGPYVGIGYLSTSTEAWLLNRTLKNDGLQLEAGLQLKKALGEQCQCIVRMYYVGDFSNRKHAFRLWDPVNRMDGLPIDITTKSKRRGFAAHVGLGIKLKTTN